MFYYLLAFTGIFAFKHLEDLYTLNFQPDRCKSGGTSTVVYILQVWGTLYSISCLATLPCKSVVLQLLIFILLWPILLLLVLSTHTIGFKIIYNVLSFLLTAKLEESHVHYLRIFTLLGIPVSFYVVKRIPVLANISSALLVLQIYTAQPHIPIMLCDLHYIPFNCHITLSLPHLPAFITYT